MTIRDIIKNSSLNNNESEILLAFLLEKRRENILSHPEEKITRNTYKKFKKLEKKRLDNWPIAYLTKQANFYKLRFIVNRNVLVPRPETELLLEEALKEINKDNEAKDIIDIGTGSGAIIISLAKELETNNPSLFKKLNFKAIDISRKALKISRKNIKLHKLKSKIQILRSNLLSSVNKGSLDNKNLVITANLPYLRPEQIKESPSIKQEPILALDGGPEGLDYYEKLFKQLDKVKYKSLVCLCEIDPEQKTGIETLIKNKFRNPEIEFHEDLKKHTRLVVVKVK